MYCKKCGKKLADGDRFCGNCGTKIDVSDINIGFAEEETKPKRILNLVLLIGISTVIRMKKRLRRRTLTSTGTPF